jgi:hypothetical protein
MHIPLTDAVEFAREDLQHNQRKAELAETGTDVRTLERSLRRANLHELFGREDDGARAMQTKSVAISGTTTLHEVNISMRHSVYIWT